MVALGIYFALSTGKYNLPSSFASTHMGWIAASADEVGISPATMLKLYNINEQAGEVIVEEPALRGGGAASHPNSVASAAVLFKDTIMTFVEEQRSSASPAWVTRLAVKELIFERFGQVVSVLRVSNLLKAFGLKYGELSPRRHGILPVMRQLQRRQFTIQLANIIMDLTAVYITTDESYCNVFTTNNMGYAPADDMTAAFVKTGAGGARLCFVQAFGAMGMLHDPTAPPPPVGDIENEFASGEMMFPAQGKGSLGDYHGNFDHKIFMLWLTKRLIPALRKLYPGAFDPAGTQRVVIGMDNAPYHVGSTSDYNYLDALLMGFGLIAGRFNPLDQKKKDLVAKLRALGCSKLSVRHDVVKKGVFVNTMILEHELTDAFADARGASGKIAHLPEVQAAAELWLMKNSPYTLANDAEAVLGAFGRISILWHPPNVPDAMPIELVWARAKMYAKIARGAVRNITILAGHIRDGLYSRMRARPGVSKVKGGNFVADASGACKSAAAIFDHVLHSPSGGVQTLINNDPTLSGTIKSLSVDSDIKQRALAQWGRNAMRRVIKEEMLVAGLGGIGDVEDGAALADGAEDDEEED